MRKYKYDADQVMFTSDTHFGHANIIQYCNRPFKDVEEMDAVLIDNWNEAVTPDQVVFHLGDFTFHGKRNVPNLLNRLNGRVILIQGNHDKPSTLQHFKDVHDIAEVKIKDREQLIVMCHYALRRWNHSFRGAWHIYGHSHGTLDTDWYKKTCDIGVDSWGYKPVSFHQLQKEMGQHGAETVDDLNDAFIRTYGKDVNLLRRHDESADR